MIYADYGINWIFPYEVIFEDEYIIILKELPRMHKGEAQIKIDAWIDLMPRTGEIYISNKRKALEIIKG